MTILETILIYPLVHQTDTCKTCDKLKVLISDETDVEKKQEFEVEKDIHLKKS